MAPLSAGLATLPQTACAIRNAHAAQSPQVLEQVLEQQLWLRDAREGWRTEWLVGGLNPLTNYSVYAVQDDTRLGGPIYFTTKSGALCPGSCLINIFMSM
jgi:calcium channel MID1